MTPYRIEHVIEEIEVPDGPPIIYNYLVYRFEGYGAYAWARTYLDDINIISIHGPFQSSENQCPIECPDLLANMTAYFSKRFDELQKFGPNGYEPIE
ncbi:hypothetical protein K3X48_03540 [Aliiroseovarius crassostreae]|uniref:Uncharacterized protein n=1 Tax=Aliiroseovarius crassostreae TaxID=154981 RepID=A0A9Q9LZZ8_9RHOB|nr:hypothetical protein [Aliiroseovarius crassostreae]UWP96079.1 hypothetical protein K3X48_03540 [Aliiroseovarius crassostreae]